MANILKEHRIIIFLRNISVFRRFLMSLGLFLIIFVIFRLFLINPTDVSVNKELAELNNLQQQKLSFEGAKDKNNELDIEFAKLTEKQGKNFIQDLKLNNKLRVISLLEKYNLSVVSFEFLSKAKRAFCRKNMYELKLSGSFKNFISFLKNDFVNNHFLKIKSLTLNSKKFSVSSEKIETIDKDNLLFILKYRVLEFLGDKKN